MSDLDQALHARTRQAVDALARAWLAHAEAHPEEGHDGWFDDLRRMIEARAGSVARVEVLGPMGGGGEDEA